MMNAILNIENLKIKVPGREIIPDFSAQIDRGKIYSIIGPNGSGKTTLLRAISRNLKPARGTVFLNGRDIFKSGSKAVARQMAVLSQTHNDSSDISVRELVTYGRFAHREWWKGKSDEDKNIIEWAIKRTNLKECEDRKINTLSGGERQRAWIAMAIAQKPQILLLDEPTTFLDISHQLEVLELVQSLNKEDGITIVMVLHDINYATRYADELIVIKEGNLFARGNPGEIINHEILKEVFNVEAEINQDKGTGKPVFYPRKVI
jgi:iron complex transport system ATP-binding protein